MCEKTMKKRWRFEGENDSQPLVDLCLAVCMCVCAHFFYASLDWNKEQIFPTMLRHYLPFVA